MISNVSPFFLLTLSYLGILLSLLSKELFLSVNAYDAGMQSKAVTFYV